MSNKWCVDCRRGILMCLLVLASIATLGQGQMTDKDKNDTLNFMNYLRKSVVPPAADMNGLLWDTNLESLAQQAANTCVFAHNYDGAYASLGEVLYLGARTNFTEILIFMFLEREIFNYTIGGCTVGAGKYPFFSTCGHYLQLATANVNKVGCGIQYCSGNYLAACEYDRQWTVPPYQQGEAGTKCGNGFATYFKDGLCYAIMFGQPAPIPGPFDCKLSCLNYGTLITYPFCSCSCPMGFSGVRCEVKNPYYVSSIPNDCKAQAVSCKNGGVPTMVGAVCKCVCPSKFAGDNCQTNLVQESYSLAVYYGGEMRYSSYYPIGFSTWNDTLKQTTRSFLTDAVNSYCAANFAACCPSATASGLPLAIAYFVTCDDFHITDISPMGILDGTLRVDVYYTMQDNVATVCNGKTQAYVNRNVLTAAWPTALGKISSTIAAFGLQVIRTE